MDLDQRDDQDAGRADSSCMLELGVNKNGLGKDTSLPSPPGLGLQSFCAEWPQWTEDKIEAFLEG